MAFTRFGFFQMIPAGYVGFGLCAMVAGAYYVDNGRFAPQRGIIMENEAGSRETTELNIPNIITLGRIILVPVAVGGIAPNQKEIAFPVFVIAGVSDAVDGFLAKRFNMTSELGAVLDPLADKALLVSIYVA